MKQEYCSNQHIVRGNEINSLSVFITYIYSITIFISIKIPFMGGVQSFNYFIRSHKFQ